MATRAPNSVQRIAGPGDRARTGDMARTSVHLVLAGAGRRRDLAVPLDVSLRELLEATGIDAGRVGVISSAGDPMDLESRIDEDTPDGTLLWIYDGREASLSAKAANEAQRLRATGRDRPELVAPLSVVALAVALTAAALMSPGGWWTAAAVVALTAAVVATLLHPNAAESDRLALLATGVGFATGAVAMSPTGSAQAVLAGGAVIAATVACVRHGLAIRRRQLVSPVTSLSAVLWSTLAALLVAGFLLDLPHHAVPAIVLAATPLVFRALSPVSVPIEEQDLLDMPFLVREAPSVRGGIPRPPRRVVRAEVDRTITNAGRRRDAGAILLSVFASVSASALLIVTPSAVIAGEPSATITGLEPDTIGGWCAVGGVAATAVFLGLWSRTASRGITRVAAGLAAIACFVPLLWHVLPLIPLPPFLTAGALLAFGALAVLLILPVQKGYRSLRWSRAGDILESVCVALAPAALLYASGLIDEIGRRIA